MKRENRHDFADRKISETLIDFAEPIVAIIDQHTTEKQVRKAFMIAVTVWNSLVFDTVHGDQKHLDLIRRNLGEDLEGTPFVRDLITRKEEHFAHDMRAISDYTVTYKDGNLHVLAEARDPYAYNIE